MDPSCFNVSRFFQRSDKNLKNEFATLKKTWTRDDATLFVTRSNFLDQVRKIIGARESEIKDDFSRKQRNFQKEQEA